MVSSSCSASDTHRVNVSADSCSNSDTHRVNVSAGSCSNSDTHRVNVSADHHCQSSVKSVVTTEITTVISYKVLICEIPRISACKS